MLLIIAEKYKFGKTKKMICAFIRNRVNPIKKIKCNIYTTASKA
jgi:hypothetical protein